MHLVALVRSKYGQIIQERDYYLHIKKREEKSEGEKWNCWEKCCFCPDNQPSAAKTNR